MEPWEAQQHTFSLGWGGPLGSMMMGMALTLTRVSVSSVPETALSTSHAFLPQILGSAESNYVKSLFLKVKMIK